MKILLNGDATAYLQSIKYILHADITVLQLRAITKNRK